MNLQDSFLAHWYYHLPNLAMAAMIYTLAGRWVLELFFAKRPDAVTLHRLFTFEEIVSHRSASDLEAHAECDACEKPHHAQRQQPNCRENDNDPIRHDLRCHEPH